jgi:alpha-L-fucosidase
MACSLMRWTRFLFWGLTLMAAASARSPASAADAPAPETPAQRDARLKWWREGRFGMFIHWGPVSLKGTEISWSRGAERRGIAGKGEIPVEVYDNLYKEFNPTKFDAKAWVSLAQAAGMKYMVLTAKHCDGFCLWPTKVGDDYHIGNSPFRRDVCGELAAAAHAANMRIGWYYSPMDWRDADCRTERNAQYVARVQEHLRELLGNYGRIDLLWFDWDGGPPLWDQPRTYPLVRRLQPQIVINDRLDLGPGRPDYDRGIIARNADYYTPEQQVGGFDDRRPWETCMTLGTQWSWKPGDELKSLGECLHILLRCAGGDGNLLLNVGPMPSGEVEPRQAERLRQLGGWLARCGESVYGTRGGPLLPWKLGVSTRKGKTVFVHVFQWPGDTITLPPIPAKIVKGSLFGGGQVNVAQTDAAIKITVPPAQQKEDDTIVVLELDRPAGDLKPVAVPGWTKPLTQGKRATASNVFQNDPALGADKVIDGNDGTRWATDAGTHRAWLEVDLGRPETFDAVYIAEAFPCRVQSFELQHQEGREWKTFLKGATIGEKFVRTFDPVTAQRVRLNILDANEGPTIWEFQLFKSP